MMMPTPAAEAARNRREVEGARGEWDDTRVSTFHRISIFKCQYNGHKYVCTNNITKQMKTVPEKTTTTMYSKALDLPYLLVNHQV